MISRYCCPMCFMLSVTLQSPSPLLFSTRPARHYISSFLLSATQEMNPGNNHSTCAQMTLHHKTDRHTDFSIDPSFFSPLLYCWTALCHSFSPLLLLLLPSLEMCSNSKSDCHISFCRSRKKKRRGGGSNENDDFSLLKSGPVVCNLLRHSTSSASLFNNFVHGGHKKPADW